MKTSLKTRKRIVLTESQFKRLIDSISDGTVMNEEGSNPKPHNSKSTPSS